MATPSTSSSEQLFQTPENVSNNTNTMQELLNDAFGIPSEHASIDPIADLDGEMPNHEVGNFDKLVGDCQKELYPGDAKCFLSSRFLYAYFTSSVLVKYMIKYLL